MTQVNLCYIEVNQHGKNFFLVNMPASLVVAISYAAVRGRDKEEGAVQRVLSSRRIANIRDFALSGGSFPNSIVMIWVDANGLEINKRKRVLSFQPKQYSAQLIDGQHRVAGLAEAISTSSDFTDLVSRSTKTPARPNHAYPF